ncbi:MAG TPA: M1 family metallopeptidase [Micromonosporaceae bacterium]|nr:M1 family metallopeptidase [Micromonosporaceae bacterium]
MRRTLVSITAVLAVVLAGAPGAALAAAPPQPGSAGIGDPYYPDYGNGGYDVAHYEVRLRYWPESDRLVGTTTILARATQDLSRFNLDFVLDVSSVRVNNRPATFAREGAHELVVTPARPLAAGQPMTVVVQYSGVPSSVSVPGVGTPWLRTAGGALAVGEPEIAWWWFPSNDHPLDKATFNISVLAPSDLEVLSNGVQRGAPRPEITGWSRWSWQEANPMAPYLAYVAIGNYDITRDTSANGQQIINAYATDMSPELANASRASIERTDEIIDWASTLFGPYPFDARGGVVVPPLSLGFALENQSRPVYDAVFWQRGASVYVVVHEIAHQWFGDSVSVHHWGDMWLNEGFATYTEWLWSESQGEGTAQELFDFTYNSIPAADPFWQVIIGDPGAGSHNLFDLAVYDRGAMALHQIRLAIGDDAFFTTLRRWAELKQHGNARIEEFQALAEEVSGQDLEQVFTTWLFTPGRPDVTAGGTAADAVTLRATSPMAPAQPRSWSAISETHRLLQQR